MPSRSNFIIVISILRICNKTICFSRSLGLINIFLLFFLREISDLVIGPGLQVNLLFLFVSRDYNLLTGRNILSAASLIMIEIPSFFDR